MTNISKLTNDCLKQISSLTSLKDIVELSAALKQLVTASEADALWEQFLPSNIGDIISRSSSSIPRDQLASKKKLFYYLSRGPILLDKNTKSFALDETSGKVCYMLGSKALSITPAGSSQPLSWKSVCGSRFPVCAVLEGVCLLEIHGKISTTVLSRVKVSVLAIREDGLPTNDHVADTKSVYLEAPTSDEERRERLPGSLPVVRGDGWMEIEMGRYQVGVNGERAQLEMILKENETYTWKKGLIVHGIEIRPLS